MRAQLNKLEEAPDDLELEMGMVIDGHSLGFALHDYTEEFLRLGSACRSVICCRVTPLQKALVVRVVKQGETLFVSFLESDNNALISRRTKGLTCHWRRS